MHLPCSCRRSSFDDVAAHDCQLRCITQPCKDAYNILLWRDKTLPCTYLAHYELESIIIVTIVYLAAEIGPMTSPGLAWHAHKMDTHPHSNIAI